MFLDKHLSIRLTYQVYNDIVAICKHNKDRYDGIGHFIRASINEGIRKHKGCLKGEKNGKRGRFRN